MMKIKTMLMGQISDQIKTYILVAFSMAVSVILFMLNLQRMPGETSEDVYGFLSWLYGSKYAYVTMAGLVLMLVGWYLFVRNLLCAYLIMEVFTYGLGLINKMLYAKRNQYLQFSHFKLLHEVMGLKLNFMEVVTVWTVALAAGGVIMAVWMWRLWKKMTPGVDGRREKKWKRVCGGVLLLVFIPIMSYLCAAGDYFEMFYGILRPQEAGSLVWLFESAFSFEEKTVTQDISEELYEKYKKAVNLSDEGEKTPNIIVVMSESFWDTDNLEGILEFSEEPLKRFRLLQEKGISGQAAVNVYGGGTLGSELEFLTGINGNLFSGMGDYYRGKKQESFVSYLKELGYYTMAFHPYEATMWNRNEIYEGMGFDEFYDMERFENRQYYRGYISDSSLSKEIIGRFHEHKKEGEPIFCFAVSVQNHRVILKMAEDAEEDCFEEHITIEYPHGALKKEKEKEVSQFVNGICSSVDALYELVDYFKDYEEEVMIVFFGDHAPDLPNALTDYYGMPMVSNVYRVPYLIWSNRPLQQKEYGDINCSYLTTILMDVAQMKKTNQYYANMYMLEHYPINTSREILANDGTDIAKELRENAGSDLAKRYQYDISDVKKLVTIIKWKMQQGSMLTDFWR